jgi:hypothetical protein
MKRSFLCTFSVLVVIITVAATSPQDDVLQLRKKYTWGSIYLTNGMLVDLRNTFTMRDLEKDLLRRAILKRSAYSRDS